MASETIKLQSNDGVIFEVDTALLCTIGSTGKLFP